MNAPLLSPGALRIRLLLATMNGRPITIASPIKTNRNIKPCSPGFLSVTGPADTCYGVQSDVFASWQGAN